MHEHIVINKEKHVQRVLVNHLPSKDSTLHLLVC